MVRMTEDQLTEITLASLDKDDNPRLREVASAICRHAHACVRELDLTHEEWLAGIKFLVDVGKFTDEKRNEMILLSDNLGVSAMVDILSDNRSDRETCVTGLGPFYIPDQQVLANGSSIIRHDVPGEPLLFEAIVRDSARNPIENALVEVWQAHEGGLYDIQEGNVPNLRGNFRTGVDGEMSFVSVMPKGYPLPPDGPVRPILDALKSNITRPAHLHFLIRIDGRPPFITHLFPSTDPYLETDPVYGVRSDLIVPFEKVEARRGDEPDALQDGPYHRGAFEFIL